jgi:N utilization substance protein A
MSEIGDREKIDIITYDEDPVKFITQALSPTEVGKVELNEKAKKAVVRVAEDQLSIAIGKHGQNVRLASKLTGYELDIEGLSGQKSDTAKPTAEAKSQPEKNNQKTTKVQQSRFKRKSELEESLLSAIDQHGEEATEAPEEPPESDEEEKDEKKSD